MKNLKRYILDQLGKQLISQQEAVLLLNELQQKDTKKINDIAIIGAACRVPMAKNKEEFWDNLINGRTCLVAKPADKIIYEEVYKNKHYAEFVGTRQVTEEDENLENYVGAYIEDFDKFDAGFFGIPPREAKYIDPQQRVFMEVAWSAIEDAGYSVGNIRNTKTGVFVGNDGTNHTNYGYITEDDAMKLSGIWEGILASRINYIFNLRGPSMVIDTACSSGLVAVHEACNALRNEECEMALAGGVTVGAGGSKSEDEADKDDNAKENDDENSVLRAVSSKDRFVRTFDKKCSGTVFGEGVVVFLLKPLANALKDRDHIYGIIKGSAINNDGASNGLTAPNPLAQEAVIIDAWKRAKVSPESISYVETHGTATLLGDPIEILGLTNAFSKYTDRKQFCGIGSVKTNVGHLVGASGTANLLKVVLSMKHNTLPPSLHFEEPNPHINFMDSPVYVVSKATEWKGGEQPLHAGVSSFGFSGTNCHMIIEEFHNVTEENKGSDSKNILTMSAKTETAMINIIKNYKEFLEDKTYMNMDDVCFTANTGRGHYGYRVAMIVDSFEGFKKKIGLLAQSGLKTIENEQVYYSKNHVVSDKRQQKTEGEISESELRSITAQAQEIADALKEHTKDGDYQERLRLLCKLYVKGANVEWTQLYNSEYVKRVPLPTYPFDRTHYWGEVKVTKLKSGDDVDANKSTHALVERCLVDSMNQSIYLVKFNLQKHWVLQDHKIMGGNLLPGTCYAEICKEAIRQCFDSDQVVIENMVFLAPLVTSIEDGDLETHIVLTKEANGASISIVSKHYDASHSEVWIEHARGNARIHQDISEKQLDFNEILTNPDLEDLPLKTTFDNNEMNAFGDRWLCVQRFYRIKDNEGETLFTEVKLSDKLLKDLEGYNCHPGMLDTALNMATLQLYSGSDFFLPFSYKNFKMFRNIPRHFYSKIRKVPKTNDSEMMSFNVVLADMEGNTIATIEETTIKKISKINNYVNSSFYGVRWIQGEAEERPDYIPQGNILIFKDKSGLADKLADKIQTADNRLYFVSFGEEYQKLDGVHYTVGGVEEDYIKLLEDIGVQNFSTVYHMGTVDFDTREYTLEQYPETLNRGLYSLVYLTRTFLKKISGNVNFVLFTENAHDVNGEEAYIKPANASFIALAKTTEKECPGYRYRCIDFDAMTEIDVVFHEALRSDENTSRAAYRKNLRYTEILTNIDIQLDESSTLKIRNEGTYIITGGTGGLGLETALYLGEFGGKCNICLIGRRKLPERSEWENILTRNEDNKLCSLLRGITQLESKGNRVILRYADVGDLEQMHKITDELKKEYGNINGVVHCAGVAGDGFLFKKSMEVFNNVINPKIYGTIILDELTRDQKMDFFIMFSSMQTIFGGPGQGDYTSANTFLDSYAPYLWKKGMSAQAINWPGWSETGMAVDYNVSESVTVFKSLATQIAINALNSIIFSNLSNIVPGQINFDLIAKIGEENLPVKLSSKLQRDLARYKSRNNVTESKEERKMLNPDELLIVGKSEEYTETEKTIAYIYANVLNLKEIDVYENFNSMGGDSILAMQLLKVIDSQYPGLVDISDIFTYSTVEELSEYIDKKKGTTVEDTGSKETAQGSAEEFSDMKLMELLDNLEKGDTSVEDALESLGERRTK